MKFLEVPGTGDNLNGDPKGQQDQKLATSENTGVLALDTALPENTGAGPVQGRVGPIVYAADQKLDRCKKLGRIARKLIALSKQLPDEKIARRFLNNCLRFDRIVNHRPVFGLRVQGSEILARQGEVETLSPKEKLEQFA